MPSLAVSGWAFGSARGTRPDPPPPARLAPASQVVPPGATAGFDITFCSKAVQTFQQAIYFSLNEHHKLKFVVFAEVVQVDLSLSQVPAPWLLCVDSYSLY